MFSAFVVFIGSFICLVMLILSLAVGFTFFIWPILFAEFLLLLAVYVMRQAVGEDDDEAPVTWYARRREAMRDQPAPWYARAGNSSQRIEPPSAGAQSRPARAQSPPPRTEQPPSRFEPPTAPELPPRTPYRPAPSAQPTGRSDAGGQDAPRPRFGGDLFRGTERFRHTGAATDGEQAAPAGQSDVREQPSRQEPARPSIGDLFRGTDRFLPATPVPDGEESASSGPPPRHGESSPRPRYATDLFRGTQRFRETEPAPEPDPRD